MGKVFVEPRPPRSLKDEAVARNLERVAWLMDRALTIPGTKISVGLDALLGLLPVGGDVVTGIVQAGLVLIALRQYKVPRAIAARMMANVLLDVAVGSIPILGDLFDVGFKANTRNIKLLEPYGHHPTIELQPRGTPWRYILPIAAVLLIALTLVLIGFITVVRWVFGF
jgi:Domain of unknown function (DUF4112)